jgi:hypothetical protein
VCGYEIRSLRSHPVLLQQGTCAPDDGVYPLMASVAQDKKSDRRTQGVMLLVVGATALWLGLSDATLAYVRAALRPPLAVSGLILFALALITLRQPPKAEEHEGTDGGDAHGEHSLRSAWLLVPVLVLLLVAPPALGSYAASRQPQGRRRGHRGLPTAAGPLPVEASPVQPAGDVG